MAYITGRYPGVSHTFITREVLGLRELGIEVRTFSVWKTAAGELLSATDQAEAQSTRVLLPPNRPWVLRAHLAALRASPETYVRLIRRAVALAPAGRRGLVLAASWVAEAVALWHACSRDGSTHIHAHLGGTAPTVALLATWLGNALGAGQEAWTWSLTVHGPAEFYDVERESLAQKVREAEFVVCISDFARSQLMALVHEQHWPKLRIVHCGVDPGHFDAVDRADRTAPLEILCVARLTQMKGQAVALHALAALVARGVDARLTLVGDGPKRAELERLTGELGLQGRVSFEGARGQHEIRAYYASADAFLLTSFAEGVPVVLMEAMATELPVVAPAIMGVGELVRDGVNGLLVSPGRADLFAEALAALAADHDERLRLGRAGRTTVLEQFDIGRSTRQLAALLERGAPTEGTAAAAESS